MLLLSSLCIHCLCFLIKKKNDCLTVFTHQGPCGNAYKHLLATEKYLLFTEISMFCLH